MSFEWQLAVRLLREGRAQTALIAAGIGLGVAVVVFLTALINGLQANLIARTLGSQAHITLTAPDRVVMPAQLPGPGEFQSVQPRPQRVAPILNSALLLRQLAAEPEITAISPLVSGAAFALRGAADKSVAVIGVDPEAYARIIPLPAQLVAGEWRLGSEEAVIGRRLADELGIRTGDRLTLQSAGGRSLNVTVRGIFELGVKDPDRRWVFLSLRSAQNLLNLTGEITGIDLTVRELFAADTVAARLQQRYDIRAESWMSSNQQLMTGLRSQSASSSVIRFFVLVSVAFGIASVLAVAVVQKQRDIGILRAMGMSRRAVRQVFLIQGGLLGLLGALAGCAAGAGLARLFAGLVRNTQGDPLFPIALTPDLFLSATAVAVVTGLIAAVLPAARAAALDPVQAIRNS
ncbi:lipoprotein-releasing system permease protein [Fluviicoccus keumensis]|uniref:Lipoprotein-releasing system permease protein n=1 Tax=Fluviicoccus keumensis TaxID=1435465 RepID=A0A4Q7ZBN7_9GAMM|nr:ABC transporter permease [Fluviicoccus keumensis]RZU48010.1 lipoprotein-releasing system permease protein [Fluviicoccus keumensis]